MDKVHIFQFHGVDDPIPKDRGVCGHWKNEKGAGFVTCPIWYSLPIILLTGQIPRWDLSKKAFKAAFPVDKWRFIETARELSHFIYKRKGSEFFVKMYKDYWRKKIFSNPFLFYSFLADVDEEFVEKASKIIRSA